MEIEIEGDKDFKEFVKAALSLIEEAGYIEFVEKYIEKIAKVDGFTQLRVEEGSLWLSEQVLSNTVDCASVIVQKAHEMKLYSEGKPYFGHLAELKTFMTRLKFIRDLRDMTKDEGVRRECEKWIEEWETSTMP